MARCETEWKLIFMVEEPPTDWLSSFVRPAAKKKLVDNYMEMSSFLISFAYLFCRFIVLVSSNIYNCKSIYVFSL